jgi:hypothetical protein
MSLSGALLVLVVNPRERRSNAAEQQEREWKCKCSEIYGQMMVTYRADVCHRIAHVLQVIHGHGRVTEYRVYTIFS